MDIADDLKTLLVGGAGGMGILALFALLFRLLFSREAKEYARLEARIVLLETSLKQEHEAHMDCVRKTGALEGRVEQLTADINAVIARHDKKTTEQIAMNRAAIAEIEAQTKEHAKDSTE